MLNNSYQKHSCSLYIFRWIKMGNNLPSTIIKYIQKIKWYWDEILIQKISPYKPKPIGMSFIILQPIHPTNNSLRIQKRHSPLQYRQQILRCLIIIVTKRSSHNSYMYKWNRLNRYHIHRWWSWICYCMDCLWYEMSTSYQNCQLNCIIEMYWEYVVLWWCKNK